LYLERRVFPTHRRVDVGTSHVSTSVGPARTDTQAETAIDPMHDFHRSIYRKEFKKHHSQGLAEFKTMRDEVASIGCGILTSTVDSVLTIELPAT
jgi:hypothetical protein